MTTATLRYAHARSRHKAKSLALPQVNFTGFFIALALVCLAMLAFYIVSVNQLTQGSYVVQNYSRQIAALSEQNTLLQQQFAQSGFLGSVQERVKTMGFEKTGQVTYVQLSNRPVGMAK